METTNGSTQRQCGRALAAPPRALERLLLVAIHALQNHLELVLVERAAAVDVGLRPGLHEVRHALLDRRRRASDGMGWHALGWADADGMS